MKSLRKLFSLLVVISLPFAIVACGGSSSGPDHTAPSPYDLPLNTPEPPVPQHVDVPIPQQSDTMIISRSENALIELHYSVRIMEQVIRNEEIISQGRFHLQQTRYWEKVGITHTLGPDSTRKDTLQYLIGINQFEKELTSEILGIPSQILVFSNTITSAFGDSGEVRDILNQEMQEKIVRSSGEDGVTTLFTVWQLVNRFNYIDESDNIVDSEVLAAHARQWLATHNQPVDDATAIQIVSIPQSFEAREDVLHYQRIHF